VDEAVLLPCVHMESHGTLWYDMDSYRLRVIWMMMVILTETFTTRSVVKIILLVYTVSPFTQRYSHSEGQCPSDDKVPVGRYHFKKEIKSLGTSSLVSKKSVSVLLYVILSWCTLCLIMKFYCGLNSTVGPTSDCGIKAIKGFTTHSTTAVYSSITSSCWIKVAY
jgi:hypothetical protein